MIRNEEGLRLEEERTRKAGELARAAEITYQLMPANSHKIEALEMRLHAAQSGGLMLRDTVSSDEIYEIAAAWTGKSRAELVIDDD